MSSASPLYLNEPTSIIATFAAAETFKILPAALAVEAAEAAIASCKGQGYNVAVAIVDRAGDLRLLLVGEGRARWPAI